MNAQFGLNISAKGEPSASDQPLLVMSHSGISGETSAIGNCLHVLKKPGISATPSRFRL